MLRVGEVGAAVRVGAVGAAVRVGAASHGGSFLPAPVSLTLVSLQE